MSHRLQATGYRLQGPASTCIARGARRRQPWSPEPGARSLLSLLVAALLALPAPASADLASHFGMNPRTMGMAGAFTAVAEDLTALYYNPAGLVQLEGMTAATGMLVGIPNLSEDADAVDMFRENSFYLHVGVPFSGKLKDHLAFGVSLNMPWGKYLDARLYKKHEPYFVMYEASVMMLQFRAGGALRIPWGPLSWLSIGGALQVFSAVRGHVGIYAPFQTAGQGEAQDPDSRLEASAEMDVPTRFFFTLGAMAFLGERWRVGVAYRSSMSQDVEIPVTLTTRLDSVLGKLEIPVAGMAQFTSKYWPQQVTVGVSYRRKRLLLSLDLTWLNYSDYVVPVGRMTLDIDQLKKDPRIKAILPDPELLAPLEPKLEMTDMLVPRLGVEYQFLDWLFARAGYFYERSPINSVDLPIYDCDKNGFALSARGSFLRPLGLLPGRLNVDVSVTDVWYVGRSVLGSEVGGHVFGFSAGVEVIFL